MFPNFIVLRCGDDSPAMAGGFRRRRPASSSTCPVSNGPKVHRKRADRCLQTMFTALWPDLRFLRKSWGKPVETLCCDGGAYRRLHRDAGRPSPGLKRQELAGRVPQRVNRSGPVGWVCPGDPADSRHPSARCNVPNIQTLGVRKPVDHALLVPPLTEP
jgi:hypothetical protein